MNVASENPMNFETEIACISILQGKMDEINVLKMVNLLHVNLIGERFGNRKLYLSSLQDMLHFFAGTGRNNYTK